MLQLTIRSARKLRRLDGERLLPLCGFLLFLLLTGLWLALVVFWLINGVPFEHHLPATVSLLRMRLDTTYNSNRNRESCCVLETCLLSGKPHDKKAVATLLRSDKYLPLLQELACSIRRTNPGLELLVLTVRGDISRKTAALAAQEGKLLYLEDFQLPNVKGDGRYAKNWFKLRAWELTDYSALILLDSDMSVTGDLTPVFALPTDFAAVLDNSRTANLYHGLGKMQAGFLFLRPCKAVADDMLNHVIADELLQFRYSTAEQDFLDWYFKLTAYQLPLAYNAPADTLDDNLTLGGVPTRVVHHTQHKPFEHVLPQHLQPILCMQPSEGYYLQMREPYTG